VQDLYWPLISFARQESKSNGEAGLGGQLLYAGRLDDEGRALVVAANVAGAATLAATDDADVQRRAIHDGVVDFLVNSLDEALRILKNEVRKRETVAVCVAASPEAIEREMMERGVAPDLIAGGLLSASGISFEFAPVAREDARKGARNIEPAPAGDGEVSVTWSVASAPAQWLPRLDAMALECLDADAWEARRWLRLAPRYLGRMAKGVRVLRYNQMLAKEFVERVREQVLSGEIGVTAEIRLTRRGDTTLHRFSPRADSHAAS
jgi:hypothetical protein